MSSPDGSASQVLSDIKEIKLKLKKIKLKLKKRKKKQTLKSYLH